MARIIWSDRLRIGVPEVDQQHERLIGIMNRLYQAHDAGRGAEAISEILDELIIYTATHFSIEEGYFSEFGYADAPAHIEEHRALTRKVDSYINRFNGNGATADLIEELLDFLSIWWRYHILDTDIKFVGLFRSRGVA